jgi:hypothetical protein
VRWLQCGLLDGARRRLDFRGPESLYFRVRYAQQTDSDFLKFTRSAHPFPVPVQFRNRSLRPMKDNTVRDFAKLLYDNHFVLLDFAKRLYDSRLALASAAQKS